MFNHSTESHDILMYIDFVERNAEEYRFTGWITHRTQKIKELKLGDENIKCLFTSRKDVTDVYPMLPNPFIGVEFSLKKSNLNIPLIVITETNEKFVVGKMIKWAAGASGFKKLQRNVTIVDNFYHDPDLIRKFAIDNLKFNTSGYHKGRRSEKFILEGTKEKFEQIMGKKIINWEHPDYANGVFQYCTPDDLIVYHSDTQTYAAVVYLTPNAPLGSGTSTYRSKITGATRFSLEEMNGERFKTTFSHGGSELNFYENLTLEPVDQIANVYNRLVIWDGQSIHAGNGYFGSNINDARFFQLFFFDLE